MGDLCIGGNGQSIDRCQVGGLADDRLDQHAGDVDRFSARCRGFVGHLGGHTPRLDPTGQGASLWARQGRALAALGQSAFIAGSAIFFLFEAVHRIFDPVPLQHSRLGIAVMVLSILVTLALVLFQRFVVRRTKSLAVKADSLHYVGDILVNVAVIVALVLVSEFGWGLADPLCGIAIAAYILVNAWNIASGALDMLMDRELPEEERARIRQIINEDPNVRGLHDLRTRASGRDKFIQCHVELDGRMSLLQAHDIVDKIEKELGEAFPGSEIILHEDPYPEASTQQ